MRYVVDTPMVAHLWAHQSQDSARCRSNFYFEGKNIYSYGSHFRCASVETNQQGELAYLVTTRTYSSTTGKHMRMVRNAIPYGRQIFNTHRSVSLYKDKLPENSYYESAYYIVDQVEKSASASRHSRSPAVRTMRNKSKNVCSTSSVGLSFGDSTNDRNPPPVAGLCRFWTNWVAQLKKTKRSSGP